MKGCNFPFGSNNVVLKIIEVCTQTLETLVYRWFGTNKVLVNGLVPTTLYESERNKNNVILKIYRVFQNPHVVGLGLGYGI